jgi:cytoskeletal protein CcmA (bactofilin family)
MPGAGAAGFPRGTRSALHAPKVGGLREYQMFTSNRKTEPVTPAIEPAKPSIASAQSVSATQSGCVLSSGVSITGSVKFRNQLQIDGEVKGTIESAGALTIGQHAHIRGEIRTKSVIVQGTVEGNIFAADRCELQAGCTLRGDIEAPRLVVDENAAFLGSAKIATPKRP